MSEKKVDERLSALEKELGLNKPKEKRKNTGKRLMAMGGVMVIFGAVTLTVLNDGTFIGIVSSSVMAVAGVISLAMGYVALKTKKVEE